MKKSTLDISNIDIFLFQISNWASGIAWYAYFAKQQNLTFPAIAAAEISVAFVGVIATTVSLRRHEISHTRTTENQILSWRLASVAVVCAAWFFGSVSLATVLALSCFALTPAHLPMKMGFRVSLLWPLLIRIPVAGSLFWIAPSWNLLSIEGTAIAYFSPGILYGIISYYHYYHRLESTTASQPLATQLTQRSSTWALATQIFVSAGANQVQAGVVASILRESASWGVVERIFRSCFSFIFPYIVRSGVLQRIRPIRLGTAWVSIMAIFFVLEALAVPAVKIIIPVSMDIFVTLFAGRSAALDAAFLFCLGLFHFQ